MKYILLIIIVFLFSSCETENKSTLDDTLQVKVISILENKLSEINVLSVQVIIMEVQSGQIKALVGLEKKDSANYQECNNVAYRQASGLIQPISILAALESGKVSSEDKFDTGESILILNGDTIKDHNWRRGGYQLLTNTEGIMVGSNIATVKAMEKAFGDNPKHYFEMLDKMSYGKPDNLVGIENLQPIEKDTTSLVWYSIGYNQLISPIQTLTFYNAIANNGIMVEPQLYKSSVHLINPQIANKSNIDFIKQALIETVSKGLGKPAASDKVPVAGKGGTVYLENENGMDKYAVEFCGYFPADNPEYSIIISMDKVGLPASGGLMAGDVFKSVLDLLY